MFALPLMLTGLFQPTRADPPIPDLDNITAYRLALQSATDPQSEAIRVELANGPRDLAREVDAARKEGLWITPSTWTPPASEDAAPLYEEWHARQYRRDTAMPLYGDPMSLRFKYTPAQIATVQKLYDDNPDVDALLMTAIKRPYLSTNKKDLLIDPSFVDSREAAREMTTKAVLLAFKGDWVDATKMQTNGFAIQRLLGQHHTVIAYLVADAVEGITVRGLDNILPYSPPNAHVCDIVTSAVYSDQSNAIKNMLQGNAVDEFQIVDSLENTMHTGSVTDIRNNIYTPEDRLFIMQIFDAAKARYLSILRVAYRVAGESQLQRMIELEKEREVLDVLSKRMKNNPIDQFNSGTVLIDPIFWIDEDTRVASEQVTLASASILKKKVETSSFPASLPGPFVDPFSGKPLVYKPSANGFVIYSVGPTGHYNGKLVDGRLPSFESRFDYPGPPPVPVPKDLLSR